MCNRPLVSAGGRVHVLAGWPVEIMMVWTVSQYCCPLLSLSQFCPLRTRTIVPLYNSEDSEVRNDCR